MPNQEISRPTGTTTTPPCRLLSLAVLITCYNRRENTLRCLRRLEDATAGRCSYKIYLVDDGCTDLTADAVQEEFRNASIIRTGGSLYWNGGMRVAWLAAIRDRPDFFLWLNDDTHLRGRAIVDMIDLYHSARSNRTLVVGCTADDSGNKTYGGYKIAEGISKLRFRRLSDEENSCDAMNGNCVLIPAAAVDEVGINSAEFTHAFGDIDYGFRAKKAGYQILELKAPVATQARNTHYEETVSRLNWQNWRFIFFHPKGVPWLEWYRFCRAHGGTLWILNFTVRYLKLMRR